MKRNRLLKDEVLASSKEFPVVMLIGPRQSGKTTLAKMCFPQKPYRSLEDPDTRAYAIDDPRGFLAECPDGAIIDEFQRFPEILSYLQGIVDEDGREGLFILTGSQHFLMMEGVSQSLAGRTAIHTLLPFAMEELTHEERKVPIEQLLFSGFFPRRYEKNLRPFGLLRDYYQTYVERDVRSLLKVHDLNLFDTFLRLCAGRVGQLLNVASLANTCGVSSTTAKQWLSLLETSFIMYRLPPYYSNIKKRLVKSPKLYFYDVGLAVHLCGVEEADQLKTHPLKGQFFENMVISEFMKHRFNQGKTPLLHFYRDSTNNEVDVLYPSVPKVTPIEIKLGQTIQREWLKGIKSFSKVMEVDARSMVIYGGKDNQVRSDVTFVGYTQLHEVLRDMKSFQD